MFDTYIIHMVPYTPILWDKENNPQATNHILGEFVMSAGTMERQKWIQRWKK